MNLFSRTPRPLASAVTTDGRTVAGTRDHLVITSVEPVETRSIPWEEIEAADWDRDASVLRVSEVGAWGEERVRHVLELDDPSRLLQLVRERVTASVVLQRHVAVDGRRGLRVIARRAPKGDRPIAWFFEYDEGIDPDDPAVRDLAESTLTALRGEVEAS